MARSSGGLNRDLQLNRRASTTCWLLALGLVSLVPLVCFGGPGFVPCMTPGGPGFQTALGDLQCIFTNGSILFVSHPGPALRLPRGPLDNLDPGSAAKRNASAGSAAILRIDLNGRGSALVPEGRRPRPELTNVYVGHSPDHWLTARPACDEVVYRQICEGTDLVFSLTAGGLAYELVADGAIEARMALFSWTDIPSDTSTAGARACGSWKNRLRLSPDFGIASHGMLQWKTDASKLAQPDAMAGAQVSAQSNIAWATYLGGATSGDFAQAIGVAAGDRPVVGGHTWSTDYPVTAGALQDTLVGGEYDAMVSALDPVTGQLLWSTYLGGENLEEVRSIGRAITGNVLVAGWTWSTVFPATPGAYDSTLTEVEAAFVAELDAATGQLMWLTLVNGTAAWGMAVASDGGIVLTGRSYAGGAPVTANAYDQVFHGGEFGDGFVARLSGDGRDLEWCTYLGGSAQDAIYGIALDSGDNVVVGGYTVASQATAEPYPVTPGSYDTVPGTYIDGVVSKLSADGRALLWSTYVGSDDGNYFLSASVLPNDNVVVAGATMSAYYPVTSDAFQNTLRGSIDAALTVLDPHGEALVYSTYLGGDGRDDAFCMCIGKNSEIIISGGTTSATFPGESSPDEWATSGEWDWFVAEFLGSPLTLRRSMVLGGSGWDQVSYVARGENSGMYLLGDTESDGLPTSPGAFQPSLVGGGRDLYVAKYSDWVTPVMIDGLRACRVGDRARVEWAISGAGLTDGLRIWRETSSVRQLVVSLDRVREGPDSWEDTSPPAGVTSYWLQMTGATGQESWYGPAMLAAAALPERLAITSSSPNPFNPRTAIRYSLPQPTHVILAIYDQRGRLVRTLVDETQPAGGQSVDWDGLDSHGRAMASGAYVVRLATEQGVRASKVTLAK